MEYYTVLLHSSNKNEPPETFQAESFDKAIDFVHQKFPGRPYRLYKGKCVPEKKTDLTKPPTLPAKAGATKPAAVKPAATKPAK